ncbi:hypothetical protein [Nocardiopsis coralliicola]
MEQQKDGSPDPAGGAAEGAARRKGAASPLRPISARVSGKLRELSWKSIFGAAFTAVLAPLLVWFVQVRGEDAVAPAPSPSPVPSPSAAPGPDEGSGPVSVASVEWARPGEGDSWLGPDPVELGAGELADINALRREDQSAYVERMTGYGLQTPEEHRMRVVLRADADEGARILGMRAVPDCTEAPLTGAYFYSPPAGAEGAELVYFDLDSADPAAQKVDDFEQPDGDYFEDTTYRLENGEEAVFDMITHRTGGYCTFTIEATVLSGDQESALAIDDGGEPFWVSGLASGWQDYETPYIGGVAAEGEWRAPRAGDPFPERTD